MLGTKKNQHKSQSQTRFLQHMLFYTANKHVFMMCLNPTVTTSLTPFRPQLTHTTDTHTHTTGACDNAHAHERIQVLQWKPRLKREIIPSVCEISSMRPLGHWHTESHSQYYNISSPNAFVTPSQSIMTTTSLKDTVGHDNDWAQDHIWSLLKTDC